jgi:radical SAM superfamily enzyme YgiQ (UPF0313 family)
MSTASRKVKTEMNKMVDEMKETEQSDPIIINGKTILPNDLERIKTMIHGRYVTATLTSSQPNEEASGLIRSALTTYDYSRLLRMPIKIDKDTTVVFLNPDSGRAHSIANFVISPYHGTQRMRLFLENNGIKTTVVDFNINDGEELLELLRRYQPPIIGFSFYYDTLERDLRHIWEIRKACPHSFLVAGGIEATARAREYVEKLPINGLLLGEGEYPLLALVRELETVGIENKDGLIEACSAIPGWLFKKRDDSIVETGPAKVMTEEEFREVFGLFNFGPKNYQPYWQFIMDNYPIELLEILDIYPKIIRVITSNYCNRGCKFCISTKFLRIASGNKKVPVIWASAEAMVEKVERFLEEDPEVMIYWDDENFLIDPERVEDFCNLIIQRGIRCRFGCRGNIPHILAFGSDRIALMEKAGFRVVATGVESWCEVNLKDYRKLGQDGDRADKAIELIQNSNMRCSINIILFGPKTVRPGLIKTLDEIVEHTERDVYVGIQTYIVPYPKTDYYDNPEYELVRGELIVPGTGKVLYYPKRVLVEDEEIRSIAERAISQGKKLLKRWKKEYNWKYAIIPREVANLAFIQCIYRELGILEEENRRERIAVTVERILRGERRVFVRPEFPSRNSSHGVENTEVCASA